MFYLVFYEDANGVPCMRKVLHGPSIATRKTGEDLKVLCKARREPTWEMYCSESVMDRIVQSRFHEEGRMQLPTLSYFEKSS